MPKDLFEQKNISGGRGLLSEEKPIGRDLLAKPIQGRDLLADRGALTPKDQENSALSSINSAIARTDAIISRIPAMVYDVANLPGNLARAKMFGENTPEGAPIKSPEWLLNNPLSKYFDKAAQSFSYKQKRWGDENLGDIVKRKNIGEITSYLAHSLLENAPQQLAILGATAAGAGTPALISAGVLSATESNWQGRESGANPTASAYNGLTSGLVEGVFEKFGTMGLMKNWSNVLAKSFGKDTAQQIVKNVFKTVLYSTAGEANEEFLTSLAQDASAYTTGVNPNALKGMAGRALEAGIIGGLSGALTTAPSATLAGYSRSKTSTAEEGLTKITKELDLEQLKIDAQSKADEGKSNIAVKEIPGEAVSLEQTQALKTAQIPQNQAEIPQISTQEKGVQTPETIAEPMQAVKPTAMSTDLINLANQGNITPEVTQGVNDIITQGGGEVLSKGSLTAGQPNVNEPAMVYFNDPKTKSTMILPIDQLTPENVKAKIAEKQALFAEQPQPTTDPLIEEAKKYDTVEGFVESRGDVVYHGGEVSRVDHNSPFYFVTKNKKYAEGYGQVEEGYPALKKTADITGVGGDNYFNINEFANAIENDGYKDIAKAIRKEKDYFPTHMLDEYSSVAGWEYTETEQFKNILDKLGYDSFRATEGGEVVVGIINKNYVLSKSQLTDIWNKAHGVNVPMSVGNLPPTPPTPPKVIQPPPSGQPFDSEGYVQENVKEQEKARGKEPGVSEKEKDFYDIAKKKLVDSNAPIEDTLYLAQKQGGYTLKESHNITNQIDRVSRAPSIAGQFAKDNGIIDVIKNVDSLENLDQYVIAKHAQTVAKSGRETGRDLAKDALLIDAFKDRYEKYAKVLTQYSQKLLDYAVSSGLISQELSDKLKTMYPDYVPLNRIFTAEDFIEGARPRGIASLSKQTVVQRLTGSELEIESPIASLLAKTNDAFMQGERNKAARLLADYKLLPGNPFQIEPVGNEGYNTVVVKGKDGMAEYRKVLKPEIFQDKDVVSYLDNGKRKAFRTTPAVAQAARAMNVQQLNILGQIFALPVRLKRIGTTGINLPFVIANIAKDQVTAAINSKDPLKTSLANPAVFFKALTEAIGHGELYEEMARQGVLGTSFDISRNQPSLGIERIRAQRNFKSKAFYAVTHPDELLRAVEDIVSRSEEFTRIQQYYGTLQAAKAKGIPESEAQIMAARASRENTVNFARRGEWGMVLNSAFMYLNAGIQGTRTFVRNAKENPAGVAAKVAILALLPMALSTAWNLSDRKRKEAYDDISEFEKENNLIIIPPDPKKNDDGTWNVIKIPLSQEINNLTSMARKPVEQAYGLDPMTAGDIVKAFAGTVSPISPDMRSILSAFTPEAVKTSLESVANYNFFTGREIVPEGLQNVSPENQYKKWTSGTARIIGKGFKVPPLKVEAWIKGTLGGVGAQALHASDLVLAGLKVIPKEQIGGQNIGKAIMARFALARGGNAEADITAELKLLDRQQHDENFVTGQEAEIVFSELKNLDPKIADIKFEEIRNNNRILADKVLDIAKAERNNLSWNDRLIMGLGVENWYRAKFIYNTTKKLDSDKEKYLYLEELKSKGIISKRVMNQITELRNRDK